jgi:hypothetical protein
MNPSFRNILARACATAWISISEFFRNELLFKDYWIKHYQTLGLDFPNEPINAAIWGLWSLLLALGIFQLSKKFNFIETALTAWLFAFLMMWVAISMYFREISFYLLFR